MSTKDKKYRDFVALHQSDGAFVMPNPWDAGSARILTQIGFAALATTSAGYAFATGRRDSAAALTRAEVLANARSIVDATHLPVSADLEDGFGADPATCAQTIRMASDAGLVGGSIEDATGDASDPIFPLDAAVARVRAAADIAQGLPFVLTARAENFLWHRPDLDDTIMRLRAFADAGAHVLYAPGLPDLAAIRAVCAAVDRPVNVVMGLAGSQLSVADLSGAGVRRISTGGSFARAALGALIRAGQEVLTQGTCGYANDAVPDATVSAMMADAGLVTRI